MHSSDTDVSHVNAVSLDIGIHAETSPSASTSPLCTHSPTFELRRACTPRKATGCRLRLRFTQVHTQTYTSTPVSCLPTFQSAFIPPARSPHSLCSTVEATKRLIVVLVVPHSRPRSPRLHVADLRGKTVIAKAPKYAYSPILRSPFSIFQQSRNRVPISTHVRLIFEVWRERTQTTRLDRLGSSQALLAGFISHCTKAPRAAAQSRPPRNCLCNLGNRGTH